MPVIDLTTVQDCRLKGKGNFRSVRNCFIQDELPRMRVRGFCVDEVVPLDHAREATDKGVVGSRVDTGVMDLRVADVDEVESDEKGLVDG